jgi:hypothetical protein
LRSASAHDAITAAASNWEHADTGRRPDGGTGMPPPWPAPVDSR